MSSKQNNNKKKDRPHKAETVKTSKVIDHRNPLHLKISGLVKNFLAGLARKADSKSPVEKMPVMLVSVGADGKAVVTEQKVSVDRPLGNDKEYARTLLGGKPIRTQIVGSYVSVGTANTAFAGVVSPDLVATSSGWLGLFDECRVTHLTHLMNVTVLSSAATNPTPAELSWAVSFDPTDNAGHGSVLAALQQQRHLGPVTAALSNGTTAGAGQYISSCFSVTKNGHYELSSGALHPLLLPNTGGTVSINPTGSSWVSTASASIIPGYFKYYCPALGASWQFSVVGYVIYTAEFRMLG